MAFEDAIELGVAAFLAMPSASDGEICERLESIGVEPWLAWRLVTWLPSAYARHLFPQQPFPEEHSEGDRLVRTMDDPVFVAAVARAAYTTRDEMEAIGLRSAELKSINAALYGGSTLGPHLEIRLALLSPLPPLEAGDGGVPEPRAAFAAFLDAHGFPTIPLSDGARFRGDLEINAYVFPRFEGAGARAQVDFEVRHPRLARGVLRECFAGSGATYREAMVDATRKFERGSVHVLIATLLDPSSCADQVDWESWPHPSGTLRACLGAQLHLYGGDSAPASDLLDALRDALARESLDDRVHAVRVFTMRSGSRVFADEVLLDGEPWPAGLALCAAHAWPVREPAWATRLFLTVTRGVVERPGLGHWLRRAMARLPG